MTSLGAGSRRPGPRFQVDAGQQGPPGDPRLLLADVNEGEALTVDSDGNAASLVIPDPIAMSIALGGGF